MNDPKMKFKDSISNNIKKNKISGNKFNKSSASPIQ